MLKYCTCNKGERIKRREEQRAFIIANWYFFQTYFNEEKWKLWQRFGKFRSSEIANTSFDFELIGEILRKEFNYSKKTYNHDIVMFFKRHFDRINEKKEKEGSSS